MGRNITWFLICSTIVNVLGAALHLYQGAWGNWAGKLKTSGLLEIFQKVSNYAFEYAAIMAAITKS